MEAWRGERERGEREREREASERERYRENADSIWPLIWGQSPDRNLKVAAIKPRSRDRCTPRPFRRGIRPFRHSADQSTTFASGLAPKGLARLTQHWISHC